MSGSTVSSGPAGVSTRTLGLALAAGGLLVVVDTTVAVVALPAMVADLGSSLPALQWVSTGYLLGVVAVIPVAGWTADRFGARGVYLAAVGFFTLASALVGLAWDVTSVITSRVLQGLGGGLINPVGQAIALRAVPRGARGRVMALLGLPVVIGPLLGPPLAGWLVDAASWRWVFWINVPVGLLAIVWCRRVLPRQQQQARTPAPVDWLGLAMVSAGGGLLVLGCTLVGESAAITSPALAAAATGAVLLAGFVVRALRVPAPLLDLRLLRHRPLGVGLVVLALFGAAYFGALSVLPVFVQGVRGDSALLAGTLTLPMAVGVGLTLQVATRLVDRVPARRIVVTGLSIALAGAIALLVTTAANSSYLLIAAAAALLGIGSGATLMPTTTVAVRDLEDTDTPRGTTLLALVQQLASALGAAAITTTLTVLVAARVPELATGPGGAGGGLSRMLSLDPFERADLGSRPAQAVGGSYLLTIVLVLIALSVAVIGLRRSRAG
ncbi:DHA2 family efflux MFS transporter permease subunit [Kineococcus arenarius]|uniref:DHA2 family efflux MFS transporter permease subunit n=1 Tax=unclassified Kineococcus TaxID=2621656 RepID=UPI003D7D0D94